jgi:hypothetical protein
MKLTKALYERWLNELYEETEGKKREGSRIRRTDPIRFNVGYNEFVQTEEHRKGAK